VTREQLRTDVWARAASQGKLMNSENSKKTALKQKATHEFQEFAGIFLYLAFFFCSVATYRMLLLNEFHSSYFNYSAVLINALVIAKVILIGEYARLGKRSEAKPLLVSSIHKAVLFTLLVFTFHVAEEAIKRLLHGEKMAGAFHNMRIDDLLASSVIVFCTFVPLFAFRELGRVLGEDKFRALFFQTRAAAKSDL
jgi:hypothetical protein